MRLMLALFGVLATLFFGALANCIRVGAHRTTAGLVLTGALTLLGLGAIAAFLVLTRARR